MPEPRQNADDNGRPTTPNFLAILSLAFTVICSPVAIVLGTVALRQIARTGQRGLVLARLAVSLGTAFTAATLVAYVGIAVVSRAG